MRTKAYDAWRESEAHAVPMTEEGVELANKRWYSFQRGFYAGIEEAIRAINELKENELE